MNRFVGKRMNLVFLSFFRREIVCCCVLSEEKEKENAIKMINGPRVELSSLQNNQAILLNQNVDRDFTQILSIRRLKLNDQVWGCTIKQSICCIYPTELLRKKWRKSELYTIWTISRLKRSCSFVDFFFHISLILRWSILVFKSIAIHFGVKCCIFHRTSNR